MTQEYDPAADMRRSYDIAVETLRARFVEDMKRLRAEAVERAASAITKSPEWMIAPFEDLTEEERDQPRAFAESALDEILAWLSEADLKIPANQEMMFRAIVKGLRREMKAVEGCV